MTSQPFFRSRAARALTAALACAPILLSDFATAPLHAQRARARSAAPVDSALFQGMSFRMLGPSRGGRVTTVAGVAARPGTFYMGSTGGGVWKTEDYGNRWVNVSDGYFQSPSLGAIQVAPSNPDVVYAGTGSDGLRSNVITGRGIYRSRDAGKTWAFIGLRDVGQIGAVEVHPTDPNVLYVAAIGHPFGKNRERGVYRSRDGGESWQKVLFVSDSVGAVDLELNPANPREIYAAAWRAERKPWTIISGAHASAGVGIYKSTDGGDTWRRVNNGLPTDLIGKIDLAVSPADPNRVYALVEALDPKEGLYRSDDRGESWRLVSTQQGLMNRPFYYTNVNADPSNADVVYVLNEAFFKSTDAGRSWTRIPTPHGDNHDMWIDPRNPNIFIEANDGGANVTLDGGRTWSTQLNQQTAELYSIAVDDRFPYWMYAGQQDNGTTIGVPSLPPTAFVPDHPSAWWATPGGCETGPAVPKPGDWTTVYTNCKGRFGVYSYRTGQEKQYYAGGQNMYGHNPRDLIYRFQRVSPIHVSPFDPNVVYYGAQYLLRSANEGRTWERISPDLTANPPEGQVISGSPITRDITGEEFFSTLYAIEESPLERGVIWTGSNDGVVSVTRDGGKSWARVTPAGLPPHARIQTVEASPHRKGEAYIAAYRYLLDDWQPYIFRTTDYGRSWKRLTTGANGIPADFPTRVVREDPERDGLLYAGTEFGLFVSWDEGARWQPLQLNLPVTPITDIALHRGDLALSTMGRGFYVLDNLGPLRQWDAGTTAARARLFAPPVATRTRYFAPKVEPHDPEYPPVAAMIDYWLGEPAREGLQLEILDGQGRVVRAFTSAAQGEASAPTQGMRGPTRTRGGAPRLGTERGMHRFLWDLRHPGPWDADARRDGQDGPMVVPGTYQVRLTSGSWSETRPLEVRLDPRVAETGVTRDDLEAQLSLSMQVRDLLSRAKQAAARLDRLAPRVSIPDQVEELRRLRSRLVTASGQSYPQPMLVAQIDYLYDMLTQAEQRPGDDALQRYATLRAELDARLAELDRLVGPAEAAPQR